MRARRPSPGSLPPGPPAPGFSLLEMLLVMALVAAASLLAVAAFGGGMQGMQLRAGARDVAAQLRFARAVAGERGSSTTFSFSCCL